MSTYLVGEQQMLAIADHAYVLKAGRVTKASLANSSLRSPGSGGPPWRGT